MIRDLKDDARAAYVTMQYRVAAAKIQYAVEQRQGLVVISGEEGTGKTTLAQEIMRVWEDDPRIVPACVVSPSARMAATVLRVILQAFGQPAHRLAAENMAALRAFLRCRREEGRTCVLVMDDAHRLSARGNGVLDQLMEEHDGASPLLQIVLLTHPTLSRARIPRLHLHRRAGVATLDSLTFEDALGLLRYRLQTRGKDFESLLPPSLHQTIYDAACGNPRALCLLGEQALARNGQWDPAHFRA